MSLLRIFKRGLLNVDSFSALRIITKRREYIFLWETN